jgi:phospholipid N-methyltransferase
MSNLSIEDIDNVKSYMIGRDSVGLVVVKENDLEAYLISLDEAKYDNVLSALPLTKNKKMNSGWNLFKHKIPMWIFIITCISLLYFSIRKNLSLIPVLGVISCLYMMAQIELKNWIGFSVWLLIGLVIYFTYGRHNSKLAKKNDVR